VENDGKTCGRNEINQGRIDARAVGRFCLFLFVFLMLIGVMPDYGVAEETVQKDGWHLGANLYLWMPTIGGESTSGDTIEVTFDDLVKSLEFGVMGGIDARHGRWHLTTDVMYMKLDDENDGKITVPDGGGLKADANMKLQSWIVTPAAGYALVNDVGQCVFEVLAGVRYLWMKPELELEISDRLNQRNITISDSGEVWDFIVGIRGMLNIEENWYAQYLLDMGTGDSTFTWQAMGGIGYRVSKVVDVVAAWRYLYWKFDDNKVLDNLYINGPLIGAKVRF